MAKFVFAVAVAVLAVFAAHASAEQFVFHSGEYELKELSRSNNNDDSTVMISRTGTAAETTLSKTITLTTDCPTKVTHTAEENEDYSVDKTITFAANELEKAVDITINEDNEEEFREFFCLTIATDPGSEKTARVYIPGNDYCVNVDTPASATSGDADDVSDVENVIYVGPWLVGEAGYPSVIDLDVQPESDGDGDDIYIWLTQNADQSGIGDYYGILLDDNTANTHSGDTNGDSVLVKDGVTGAPDKVGVLNDSGGTIADVVTTGGQSFTLEYDETDGSVILEDQSDPTNKRYSGTSGANDKVDVSHLFVSSGGSEFASWKVCGLLPRKLPTIGTDSSGYVGGRSDDKATDGNKDPNFNAGGCFISSEVIDPWIQIDLGREFDVKLVLIYPITSDTPTADDDWLDNAKVYVGSCPSTSDASITSNTECDSTIGDVGGGETVIQVDCQGKNYGRYVYIYKDTTTAEQINLCEVEVYGDDIPYDDQTVVEFKAETFQTSDDESAEAVIVTAKRTGSTAITCTTADFYTDTVTVPGGESGDFTAVLSTAPYTFEWDADDDTTTENEKTYTIPITNDNECEPIETFNVYLTNVNGGILGDQSCSSVSINDDDSVTYSLSQPSYTVTEGSSINIGVSRTGTGTMQEGSAELTFTSGSASSEDYASATAEVEFTASSPSPQNYQLLTYEDHKYEDHETLTVSLENPEPSTCSFVGTPHTATVTIENDDSKFKWDVSDNDGFITISEGTATTSLSITREGDAQSKTININVEEVSTSSSDFSVSPTTVTFPSSDDTESVTVTVVDDSDVEGDETFTLTLEDPNYTTGHKNLDEPYRLTVTIQDNDAEYYWTQSQYDAEESAGTVQVCLKRTGDTSTTKTIQINSAGSSAVSGSDFTPLTQITFSGSAQACQNIAINNDNSVESTEVFTVTIASGQQDVQLGSPSTASVHIVDNDYTVSWDSTAYSFAESSSTSVHYVTITKTGSGSPTVTITSQQETAREGIDYAPVSTSVTISGSSAQIPITIYDDDEYETSETFTLTLSGTGVTSSSTRITITSDDPEPTEAPDTGLSTPAIAGIAAAAVVGAIVLVVAVGIFLVYSGLLGGSSATAAGAAAAAAAKGSAAAQGYGLNYELSGLSSYGNGFYNGYGNGLGNQGFQGYQPSLGYR